MTAKSNKRIMERFTSEFLPTGDVTLAEAFLSSDIVMRLAELRVLLADDEPALRKWLTVTAAQQLCELGPIDAAENAVRML